MAKDHLLVKEGWAAGAEIQLEEVFLIGRSAEGEGRLGGDPEISREHARVTRRGDRFLIEDLGSRNGTYVNGARIAATRPLVAGDTITLGRTTLELRAAADAAAEPVRSSRGSATALSQPIEQKGSPSAAGWPKPAPGSIPAAADVLHAGRRVPIGAGGLSIGRRQDNDLVVASESVSRAHARIVPSEGRHYVADLNTVNGTYLNGERLRGESRWLNAGDTITVGGEPLRFVSGQETRFGAPQTAPLRPQPVHFDGRSLAIGRDPSNDVVLTDPNVSRFHAEVVTEDGVTELRDLDSRNGTRLNGIAAKRAALTPGSEIGIGPFRLIFDGDNLLQRDDRGALRLDIEGLTVRVKGRTILNSASVTVEPGEFVAVIGESGSGKSTMIKAAVGVTTPSGGAVRVNGEPVQSRLTDIGYVPQDEIVHPDLTVLEALRYAAKLRLPGDSATHEIEEAVQRVLEDLSLEEQADTRIGSLSGGQRKRTGVAAELLNRPSLLFLDEPTTGLDPGLETRLMELFRELAEPSVRAVTVVTHATKNLGLADKICVMGRGGEVTFFGPPEEALRFFDFDTYDGIYSALDGRPAVEWRRDFDARQVLDVVSDATPVRASMPAEAAPRRNVGRQVSVLAQRYLKLFTRDRRNLAILLGQVPVIGLGIALLFKTGVLDQGALGRPGDAAQLLFLLVTTAIWLGSIDGSREIIKERALAAREAAVGVKLGTYLCSKVLVLFALVAVQTALLVAIVFAIHPLHEPISTYLVVLGLLVLTGFVAIGVGLLVSSAVDSEDQATSFIPLVLIPQLLFAGAIVSVKNMGEPVATLSNAVFARWSFGSTGTAIDMNERIADDPDFARLSQYGSAFFDLSQPVAVALLIGFLALFLGGTALMVGRRDG